jgi:type VI secretion system protein ImpJ
MSIHVHWHEGLFLQPHHLQLTQWGLRDQMHTERRLGWHFPYGLIESRLSSDDLENQRIRVDKLRAIMPSGLEVNYPDNAELPSLDIKAELAKSSAVFPVYLGVPLWYKDRANTFQPGQAPDPRVKLLYRLKEAEFADENTGENRKPVLLRMINARLLLEHEDRSDMEVLPLLKIKPAVGEDIGMPRQDPEFAPPCLVLNGSPILRELVRDLVAQVEASRKELVVQVSRSGFSIDTLRGVQFEQLMRLRALNRFSASLPSLIQSPAVAPFVIYLELRELLAELAALYPDRDPFE